MAKTAAVGAPAYTPPELLLLAARSDGSAYDGAAIDVWASGIILYCLLTAKLPFLVGLSSSCTACCPQLFPMEYQSSWDVFLHLYWLNGMWVGRSSCLTMGRLVLYAISLCGSMNLKCRQYCMYGSFGAQGLVLDECAISVQGLLSIRADDLSVMLPLRKWRLATCWLCTTWCCMIGQQETV